MSYDPYIILAQRAADAFCEGFREALLLFWHIVRRPWRIIQTVYNFVMRKSEFVDKSE